MYLHTYLPIHSSTFYTMLPVNNSLTIHVQCMYLALQNSTQYWHLFFSNEGNHAKNKSFTNGTTSLLAGESAVHLICNMCKFWLYADFFRWLTTNIKIQHVSVCSLAHAHHFLHVLVFNKMKRDKDWLLIWAILETLQWLGMKYHLQGAKSQWSVDHSL